MNSTEQITPASIRELIDAKGPCITMVVNHQAAVFKEAVSRVRTELGRHNGGSAALLEPILEQNPGFRGSADAKSSVAIFRCPEVMLTVPVDSSIRPVVKVGETFDLRTILAVSDQLTPFYILALSQKRTRLLECTRRFSKEVPNDSPDAPREVLTGTYCARSRVRC